MIHHNFLLLQDEDAIPELPPEVLERLLRRPEDLPDQVTENVVKYKNKMLRMLEVCLISNMNFVSLAKHGDT